MMLHLYGIYDRKARYFINVFPSQNDQTALRSFDTLIHQSKKNLFADYPEDFELRYVCSVIESSVASIGDRNLLADAHITETDIDLDTFDTELIQRGYKIDPAPSNLAVELDENLRPVLGKESTI